MRVSKLINELKKLQQWKGDIELSLPLMALNSWVYGTHTPDEHRYYEERMETEWQQELTQLMGKKKGKPVHDKQH